MTSEKPEIRSDVEFRDDFALVERATFVRNPDDAIYHQHVGHGQLRVARAKHRAVTALEQLIEV
jgi:hypothetical protein